MKAFEEAAEDIDSASKTRQTSNEVLRKLLPSLENLGFTVESGKTKDAKIHIPVLFGRKGKVRKSFNADAYCIDEGWVLEERRSALSTTISPKDIFKHVRMHECDPFGDSRRND